MRFCLTTVFRSVVAGACCISASAPLLALQSSGPEKFTTVFEISEGRETPQYAEGIQYYQTLDSHFPELDIKEFGKTDCGFPLHVVLLSIDQDFDIESNRKKGRSVLLINNAIHPGESDGVDASMLFLRELLTAQKEHHEDLSKVLIAIIPYYNIGGALNRNRFTRANQNGPEEYGFRGNARNFDLNRDFIKCDTLNARTFASIFHYLDPDLFIDTHVSNGADYQYVMTTSHSQKDKLGGALGKYLDETFEPQLFGQMEQKGYPTVPYVNAFRGTPDQGFSQFLETPRYSTGYAALFHTMGFMTETHMLKPYAQRVDATRVFMHESLKLLADQGETIRQLRQSDRDAYSRRKEVPVTWQVDRSRHTKLRFLGYEGSRVPSQVTSGEQVFYDRSKPFEREIEYYNHFVTGKSIELPAGYLIPRGWHQVIELMRLNHVEMQVVDRKMKLECEAYRIEEVTTLTTPYEGHYMHERVRVSRSTEFHETNPGDVLISLDQPNARYVVETLEPEAVDSLFRWNFFDTVLQQKEGYSPYVFEETLEQLLQDDPELREDFEQQKKENPSFASRRDLQLAFLFQRSRHYEPAHRRYPVLRVLQFDDRGQ